MRSPNWSTLDLWRPPSSDLEMYEGEGDGSGEGSGLGDGSGVGDGSGEGSGLGDGSGVGDGSGEGSGLGDGSGVGDGSGEGSGLGDGSGVGEGLGDGAGEGDGPGEGVGLGVGAGAGDGGGDVPGGGSGSVPGGGSVPTNAKSPVRGNSRIGVEPSPSSLRLACVESFWLPSRASGSIPTYGIPLSVTSTVNAPPRSEGILVLRPVTALISTTRDPPKTTRPTIHAAVRPTASRDGCNARFQKRGAAARVSRIQNRASRTR